MHTEQLPAVLIVAADGVNKPLISNIHIKSKGIRGALTGPEVCASGAEERSEITA